MANEIPIERANEMIEEYISYMQKHDIDMKEQTHNVTFDLTELTKWLSSITPYSDNLKICMGVYRSGDHAGRITTILWPYNGDSPAEMPPAAMGPNPGGIKPYNDGTGTP